MQNEPGRRSPEGPHGALRGPPERRPTDPEHRERGWVTDRRMESEEMNKMKKYVFFMVLVMAVGLGLALSAGFPEVMERIASITLRFAAAVTSLATAYKVLGSAFDRAWRFVIKDETATADQRP